MSDSDDQMSGVEITARADAAFRRSIAAASIAGPLGVSAFILLVITIILIEWAITDGIHARDRWTLIVAAAAFIGLTALTIFAGRCGGRLLRMSAALSSVPVIGTRSSMLVAVAWPMRIS